MSTLAVVIPTRNMASTLGRALGSACHGGADEIVVVDDASEDDTAAVVERYQNEFPVVQYVRHPQKTEDHNAAQMDVWMGLKSDQVVGLAADDWLYSGAIEAMKSCSDAPAVFTDMDVFNEHGTYLGSLFHNWYGRKSAREVRSKVIAVVGAAETGFACAIRSDISRWLWTAGWHRLGPMMDNVGLTAAASTFGAAYMGVKGGAFTVHSGGSYGLNPNRTAEEYYELGKTAVAWLFSVGLDAATVRAIAGRNCCLNTNELENVA